MLLGSVALRSLRSLQLLRSPQHFRGVKLTRPSLKYQLGSISPISTHIQRKSQPTMATIKTAAILVIGDEILNGKIRDSNSHFFAKTLFERGVELKKVLVVGDYEDEIVEAVRSLHSKYDFVVTSGGIGPTLDDITYESLAKAFNLPLKLHQKTVDKMKKLRKKDAPILNEEEQRAQHRMAIFPDGDNTDVIFLHDELWVPVVGVDSKVFVLPGIPQLFERLLLLLLDHFKSRIVKENAFIRYFIRTPLSESQISPFLVRLQSKGDEKGIKVGSYPHMGHDFNTVSILGRSRDNTFIKSLVDETVLELRGEEIDAETESQYSVR